MVNAQEWLDQNYSEEERKKLERIHINKLVLEGELNLTNFINLKEIYCSDNQLTTLNLSNCLRLEYVYCNNNQLTHFTLPTNPTNLRTLLLCNNNFPLQDLSFLTPYTNLEWLELGNLSKERIEQGIYNKFTGSLDYLSRMEKLVELDISNTDINVLNWDKLPNNLEGFYYSTELRPSCKLTEIVPQLNEWEDIDSDFSFYCRKNWEKAEFNKEQVKEWIQAGVYLEDYNFASYLRSIKKLTSEWVLNNKYTEEFEKLRKKCNRFNWCRKCQQLNINEDWCRLCWEQGLKKDLEQLTGQELIEKFIQKQPLGKGYKSVKLEWISYEVFTNIEYLAKGGFGKIYKADCGIGEQKNEVVLKSLNNSQNITFEFLTEVANNGLLNGHESIVRCHGISQDPETKDYIMVMEYKKDGNLRDYLKNNVSELRLKDKLDKLWAHYGIVRGLEVIHAQNLVHRDFHSGNILCDSTRRWHVTDLGLSKPANSWTEEGKIFGVLPYVAPEVLRGQPYTQASDIYSWGIIAYELLANSYPYPEIDDLELSLKVCNGYRPNLDELKIPKEVKDLIKKCWDADPKKRPTAGELRSMSEQKNNWIQETEEEYNRWSLNTSYKINSTTTTTSRLINTKEITERLKTMEYPQSLTFDFGELNLENQDWTNIHSSFTSKLIQSWQNLNFTYQQTQDWINVGLQPTDHYFATYLRDTKHLTPEEVLNNANEQELRTEYQDYQTQIEIPPK